MLVDSKGVSDLMETFLTKVCHSIIPETVEECCRELLEDLELMGVRDH